MGYIRTSFLSLDIADVDNEQILQNEISLGRWLFDATMLLFSEGESCDLQKKLIIRELNYIFIPTIYWDKGCKALEIHGRTVVEIKNNLLASTEFRQSKTYSLLLDNNLVDKVIVLYISDNNIVVNDVIHDDRILYYSAKDFVNSIKVAIKAGKGDVIKRIRQGENEVSRRWKETREDRLVNAINDLSRYDSVFFIGAGVSASTKAPSWDKLLSSLLPIEGTINQNDFEKIFKQTNSSNLITARYIQKFVGLGKKELVNKIRDLLYPQSHSDKSNLISSICDVITKHKNVRAVITYNYDTYIEDNLRKSGIKCYSVYKYDRDEINSLPVYHVHGIVYRNDVGNRDEDIVLSEDDYHNVYSQVFDWSNVEQLHALTRCTCFFIGLSMKDPNLRRLLEIANGERSKMVRHYVFLERISEYNEDVKCERDFQTREDLLADLGLNVIWYKGNDNHKELPDLLYRLAGSV